MSDGTLDIEILRRSLDELFSDPRFFARTTMSPSQVADYILTLISKGERNVDLIKTTAFKKFAAELPSQQITGDGIPAAGTMPGK